MKNRLFTIILMLFLSVGILSAAALAAPSAGGAGLSPDNPMVVPAEGMIIKGNTYYGISKAWFAEINPNKDTMYFSVKVPGSVTSIIKDGFRDSYTSDKERNGAVTYNDNLGRYNMVAIDFSEATNLTTINNQAANGCSYLSGVLDLSKTNITTLGKSAFSGCTGLTGVILPDTLEVLGEADGSAGSVFNGCTGLQFVRTARSDKDAVFELPSNLRVIGKQTFRNAFTSTASIVGRIPDSVEIIGSEAFYSRGAFSQIYIDRQSGYDGYDTGAFKNVGLLILPNNKAYNDTGSFTRTTKTYPVKLKFMNGSALVARQLKLYGQSIQYTQDDNGIWYQDNTYALPDPGSVVVEPGYDAGWRIDGDNKVLANTSRVSGWQDAELKVTVVNDAIVSKPTVEYSVNGSVVQYAGTGVPQLEVAVGPGSPGSVGVQVTHPLATEEARASGTYVYFEYCWWDEMDDGVNGPRSKTEPGLFSTSTTSSSYNRVYTEINEIPIRSSADARTDGDYYMVEIFGYYVKDGETARQFYKSSHNFIGASDTATDARSYVMNVNATDAVTVAIVPADITVYVGGSGYVGAVDGDGAPLEEDNGFPVPGFTISAEGLDNFDPAK
uniref:leucine-rich repeat domain-containing protein n=1 Tax=Candidatus Scatomorpha intestinigallinarum TaxID=2840923 RepID=UPI0040293D33